MRSNLFLKAFHFTSIAAFIFLFFVFDVFLIPGVPEYYGEYRDIAVSILAMIYSTLGMVLVIRYAYQQDARSVMIKRLNLLSSLLFFLIWALIIFKAITQPETHFTQSFYIIICMLLGASIFQYLCFYAQSEQETTVMLALSKELVSCCLIFSMIQGCGVVFSELNHSQVYGWLWSHQTISVKNHMYEYYLTIGVQFLLPMLWLYTVIKYGYPFSQFDRHAQRMKEKMA